jgi:DNA-binding transcriptional ArsR family regulator
MTSCRKTALSTPVEPLPLDRVLKSLGDPVRLSIVRQLLTAAEGELACGCFEYDVTKATFSHHMAILEEAGLVQGRPDGTRRIISLRLEAIKQSFPGLLDLIRATP